MDPSQHAGPAARRYAAALFAAAEEGGALEAVVADMQLLQTVLGDADTAAALADPRVDDARLLATLQKGFGEILHALSLGLLSVLGKRKRLPLLLEVPVAFGALVDEHEGRLRGVLESAREIDAESWAALEKSLSEATGRKVSLEARVHEELLGGVRVTLAGTRYDGSARGRLETLRQRLEDVELG